MTDLFLDERLRRHASSTPDALAIGTPGRWCSYGELAHKVMRVAAALQARGLTRGQFVLNLLPNGLAGVVAGLAVQRTGACLVELNRDWGQAFTSEVAHQTGASYAFAHPADLRGIDGLVPLQVEDLVAEPSPAAEATPRSPDDLAMLLFTSATTGRPRGVMLTHRNITSNTASIVEYLGLTSSDRVLSILPLSYSYGRSLLQTHLWVGGSIVFDNRFMYPRTVLETIGLEGCTGFAGVPVTFEILRRRCDPRSMPLTTLRYVTQAGGPMSVEMREWVRAAFAPARFFVMYGQTEATARLSYLPPERLTEKPSAVGIPIPGVELRVVNDAGSALGTHVVGNLIARGQNITPGYFQAPEETQEILRNGWLWTGDLAYRDDEGFFFLAGRRRSMLKVNGHRFAPEEIEFRLEQHPIVREACVVGAPDPLTTEAAWAFVAVEEAIDVADLQRFCAFVLPSFKVPKHVILVEALPRSSAGKIQRAELESRARAVAAQQAALSPPEQR